MIDEWGRKRKCYTSRTDGSTGSPKCSVFLPGVTPPTILVPHANDSLALDVAFADTVLIST